MSTVATAPAATATAPPRAAPPAKPGDAPSGVAALADLVGDGGVAVLSGAGLSTESGIPDYRGPSGALRRRTPMTFQTFLGDPLARQRYWARSHVGWRHVASAVPNAGHRAVAGLQARGLLAGIVTQNVDGLHRSGGARGVIELHGNLRRVVCLDCGDQSGREDLDRRLRDANPAWQPTASMLNPDGDVDLDDRALAAFRVVGCERCGGVLKPDVVFFGETVPPARVQASYALVESASLLLVLGSSLTVMSGRRFVLRAAKLGVPVAIVNQGVTRSDEMAAVRVDASLGAALPALVHAVDAAALTRGMSPASAASSAPHSPDPRETVPSGRRS